MEKDGDSNLAAHLHMRQLYNEKWGDQQVPELLAQANPSTGLKHFCSVTPIMSLGFSCAKEWYGICVWGWGLLDARGQCGKDPHAIVFEFKRPWAKDAGIVDGMTSLFQLLCLSLSTASVSWMKGFLSRDPSGTGVYPGNLR